MQSQHSLRTPAVAGRFAFLALTALAAIAHPGPAYAAADAKTLAKCQAGLTKSGAKFVGKKLASLAKCTSAVFKCIQTVDETPDAGAKRAACITKARAKCSGAFTTITAARQAFVAGVDKACGGLDPAQITGADGLGYLGADCAAFGGAVTDLASLTTCLAKQHDCAANDAFQLQVPRVLELLQFTPPAALPITDADALVCFDDIGGSGADVNDVVLGKSVAKCQAAVAKIGTKLTKQRLGALGKCVDALFTCSATKTGNNLFTCNTKAQKGCTTAFDKTADASEAAKTAVAKACGTIFAAFLAPTGGNLQQLLASTATLPRVGGICSSLTTIADYELCLTAHLLGIADDLVSFETPRTDTLLSAVGCSTTSCTGSVPTPNPTPGPETPGITRILDASGDGVHPFNNAVNVAADGLGNVYAVGRDSDNAFKVSAAGVVTQIIDATGDGQGHQLDAPSSVAAAPNGTVYVSGSEQGIFRITPAGTITHILAETGDGNPMHPFGGGKQMVALDDGTVYAAGGFSSNAYKVSPGGGATQLLDFNGDGLGHEADDTFGIALDTNGNVFVSSSSNAYVFKIAPGGSITTAATPAGDGTHPIDEPWELATFGTTLYIGSEFSDSVFKVLADGTITRILDKNGDGAGHKLFGPRSVAVDGAGNVYAGSTGTPYVFRITPGGVITTVIGPDGDGKGHTLVSTRSVAVGPQGQIYVTGNSDIFKVVLP